MFKFLKNLFGGSEQSSAVSSPVATGTDKDYEIFVEYVVTSLVDEPKAVRIERVDDEKTIVLRIHCEKTDIAKIIGKNGKTIQAIRSLVNSAAGRNGKRANVEVVD